MLKGHRSTYSRPRISRKFTERKYVFIPTPLISCLPPLSRQAGVIHRDRVFESAIHGDTNCIDHTIVTEAALCYNRTDCSRTDKVRVRVYCRYTQLLSSSGDEVTDARDIHDESG